ncbi:MULTISPECIES: sulfatase-like hydrolase/transferase [unclassified Nocardiopsis]|uniref:sulfatase-like hydrolase/transferase n=1 Tax=Nocardiopsis TaxID=2013 RepID=UPI00387AA470
MVTKGDATQATHAPHHAPKEWADKYRGHFDQGWDRLREETLARQKELGVVPADCELTERAEGIPAWDDVDDDLKPVLARQMEVYAGYLEYADHHVGRLIDAIDHLGALDDTLVYYIIGDNGASAEGTMYGTTNEMILINHRQDVETPEYLRSKIDELGGPTTYNHYAIGWAHAMDAPFQWTKQAASHWGGTRNGTIVHWPGGIKAKGQIRSQFSHVIDVAPTILEAAGIPEPTQVHGVTQEPMHGTAMTYSFEDGDAPERHETQYFEMVCNRGIYHRGWSAVTLHKIPWLGVDEMGNPELDDDAWELYDGSTDYSQARNLAEEHPEKLCELQRLFLLEARRYNALPLDDRSAERFNADLAGRPQLIQGTSQILYPGMVRLSENSVLGLKNKSYSVTAEVDVPDGVEGVIVAQGGRFGGWSLYCKDGHLKYCYNLLDIEHYTTATDAPLPPGKHQVRMELAYDGGGLAKGGTVTLYVDGDAAGSGRVDSTEPFTFSMDETTDVGGDSGSPVSEEYGAGDNRFTGTIDWVRLDTGDDGHDHLIDPDHLYRIAMTKQ